MEKKIILNGKTREYSIFLSAGSILRLKDFIDLKRKVLIVTDSGVPQEYAASVKAQCKEGYIVTIKQGEGSKSFDMLKELLAKLQELSFGREDMAIAVGGGVVGDLTGFAAASYMRGIAFVNIPTTTLSQIDSSIGGKTAVNFNGVKNNVGAFYQPIAVVADPDVLKSLSPRQYNNGMVEALKAGLIADKPLFELFLQGDIKANQEEIISRAVEVKRRVVEQDEEEKGLRKILNFGHTIGHGLESAYGLSGLLHGEAVAAGMLPMIDDKALREQTEQVLRMLDINPYPEFNPDEVYGYITKDKKAENGRLTVVRVKQAGEAYLQTINTEDIKAYLGGRV